MKKALLFLFLFGVSFLFFDTTKAQTQQINYATEFDGGSTSLATFFQYFLTPPTSDTTPITKIKIRFKPDNACDWKLKMTNTSLQTLNSNNLTLSAGEQFAEFTWSSNSNFRLNNLYSISLDAGTTYCGTGNYTGSLFGVNTTSTYPNGRFADGTKSVKNLFFALNGETAEINFTETPTSTCQFQNWAISSYIPTEQYNSLYNGSYVIGYNNGASGDTVGGYFFYDLGSPTEIGDASFYVPHNGSFPEESVFYARAFICEKNNREDCWPELDNEHLIAQSNEYTFTTNAFDSCTTTMFSQGEARPLELLNDNFTQLTDEAYTNCENMENVVAKGLCKALVFLFVPNNTVLNNFVDLKDTLNTKPPFGYFSIYSETLENFEDSTITTSTINNTTLNETFIAVKNITIFDTFYNIVIILLWCGFGFYIIKRFKNFKLE